MILVNEPLLNGNEKKYLAECIETGWISSGGRFVSQFEEEMAQRCDRKYGVAVTNGTAALEAAIVSLGLEPGSEVIMPSFTIISCASAILRANCIPVFVDCDAESFNMDVDSIEEKISPKTRAIMAVHIYGLTVDIDRVLQIAEKHNLRVIEDAAQAIGQTYKNKPCGSFGDISTFSFYPNKHITTGEGGMVLMNDENLARKCKSVRDLCFIEGKRFVHEELGWNLRMSNIQAAVGVAQLEQLDTFIEKKRKIGALYNDKLEDNLGFSKPVKSMAYASNIYWVYPIVIDDSIELSAAELMMRLREKGIDSRPFFFPMHEQPVFKEMDFHINQILPNSEKIARKGLYLPSGLNLTNELISEVSTVVNSLFKEL